MLCFRILAAVKLRKLRHWLSATLEQIGFLGLSLILGLPTAPVSAQMNRRPAVLESELMDPQLAPSEWDEAQNTTDSPEEVAAVSAELKASEMGPSAIATSPSILKTVFGERDIRQLIPKSEFVQYENFAKSIHGTDSAPGGLIKEIGDRALAAEKNRKISKMMFGDPKIQSRLKAAKELRKRLESKLFSKTESKEARRAYLQLYFENVMLPLRKLLILSIDQSDNLLDPMSEFSPHVPKDLVEKASDVEKFFEDGNPAFPNGMKFSDFEEAVPMCVNQRRFEFDFSPITTLTRDIQVLSSAVTKENYMKGIKLMTLQMLTKQIASHNEFLGLREPIQFPEGCRKIAGGMLPAKYTPPPSTAAEQNALMNSMLQNLGFIEGSDAYKAYYRSYVRASPESGGFTGYLPFEKLYSAQRGIDPARKKFVDRLPDPTPVKGSGPQSFRDIHEPAFDDQQDFPHIYQLKVANLKISERSVKLAGPIIQKMITPASGNLVLNPGEAGIAVDGFPQYLVDRMKSAKVYDWKDPKVLCPAAKAELESSVVRLPMPRLDGPDANRRWGVAAFGKFADEYKNFLEPKYSKSNVEKFQNLVREVCVRHPKPWPGWDRNGKQINAAIAFCDKGAPGARVNAWLAQVSADLGDYRYENEVIAKSVLQDSVIRSHYPTMARVWELARGVSKDGGPEGSANLISGAHQNELTYLASRMDYTPWAALRAAYVIAKNCEVLPAPTEGAHPLASLGATFGVDVPLAPDHGNRLLSPDEKEMLWKKIADEMNESMAGLAVVEGDKLKAGKTYNTLDRLNQVHRSSPLLTKSDAVAASKAALLERSHVVSAKKIEGVFQEPENQSAETLFQIYESRNSPEKQEELMAGMLGKFEGVKSAEDVKIKLLSLDSDAKKPIYQEILKEAAVKRKALLQERMKVLCSLDPVGDGDSLDRFKEIVYSTVKVQDELNEALGLPGLPESVTKELKRWSKSDWNNMKLTGLQLVFFASAAILTGGCVVGSGGLCAPVAAAVLSAAATGTQLQIFKNSLKDASNADERAASVKAWADLGFSTTDEVKKSREGKSYMMASLDAVFVLPLLSSTAKSLQMATRALTEKGGRTAVRNLQKFLTRSSSENLKTLDQSTELGKKTLASIGHEVEVKGSMYTLGYRKAWSEMAPWRVFQSAGRELFMPLKLKEAGVTVETTQMLFSKTLSQHFGNNVKKFRSFLNSYGGNRLGRMEVALRGYEKKYLENPNLLRRLLLKTGFPQNRIEKLTSHLLNGKKIRTMMAELNEVEKMGGSLEKYISENADSIRGVLAELPVRKREIPYYMLVQGSPLSLSSTPGLRQTIGLFDESLQAHRIALAAENLLFEAGRAQAYKELNVESMVAVHNTYDVVRQFLTTVDQSLSQSADKDVLAKVNKFQSEVAERIVTYQRKNKPEMRLSSADELKSILFNPKNDKERAMAQDLWNSTPTDQLFLVDEMGESADKIVKRLSNYSNVDEFENFLSALKVLTLSKRPKVMPN
jgi:hypothetical protein